MAAEHVKTLPIFWGIGSADIRYKIIRESADFVLSEMGVPTASGETSAGVELHTYNGLTHSTSAQEMQDLGAWLRRVVPAV
jgi:lysophospholipase-1